MEKQLLQQSSAEFNAVNASRLFIQPKLTINQPNDVYEQEADAMADKVMRMEQPGVQLKPLLITSVQRKCDHCEEEEKVQRKEMGGEEATADYSLENYVGGLTSGGQPLPNKARNFYEPRFGYDFSNVKIHTDTVAAKSAQSINALAYTSGNNIVFNSNQYSPNTESGKRLLGHELTHVVQQGGKNSGQALHRQPVPAGGASGEAGQKSTASCVQDGTDKQIELKEGTVSIFEYGADWCAPCKPTKIAFEEVCNSLSNTKLAMPVRFFGVDVTDSTRNTTTKPAPQTGSLPTIVIYAGTKEVGRLGKGTFDVIKESIIKALNCASQPGSSSCKEVTPGNSCTLVSAVPKGSRFKFNVGTADFAPGEQKKLEDFAKKVKAGPASTVNILGMASFDGDPEVNKSLSCSRGFAADIILKKEGLNLTPVKATGGVAGSTNNPEYRATDIEAIADSGPGKITPVTPKDCKDPASILPCVFKPVLTGPIEILDTRDNPKATDPKDKETTSQCQTKLFKIETTQDSTTNIKIKHVQWRKLPPPNTRSVIRTAFDNQGDQPSGMTADGTIKPKRASFASLSPADFAIDKVKSGCEAKGTNPVWCVPFCSFGEFQMEAWVTWECEPDCLKQTDITYTGPIKINVKEIK